jgi:hypothetical protein
MSENENGVPSSSDSTEAKTTIGMPAPTRPAEDDLALTVPDEEPTVSAASEDGAQSGDGEAVSDESSVSAEVGASEDEQFTWPIDPEHTNAISALSEQISGVSVVEAIDHQKPASRALNFILLVAVIASTVIGIQQVSFYSSPDRAARLTERVICEAEYDVLKKRAAGEKQLGTLQIESAPTQAKVYRRGEDGSFAPVSAKTSEGETMDALTPATLSNLDINQTYTFRLSFTDTLKRPVEMTDEEKKKMEEEKRKPEMETHPAPYREEEFTVARYQWIQDGGTGTFRFQKIVSLVPSTIEYWHAFNWKTGKAERFETSEECNQAQSASSADMTLCRAIPFVESWERVDKRREEAEKQSKRGKRGRKRRRR